MYKCLRDNNSFITKLSDIIENEDCLYILISKENKIAVGTVENDISSMIGWIDIASINVEITEARNIIDVEIDDIDENDNAIIKGQS